MQKLRIYELDALRFIAAISVVFYHYTYRQVHAAVEITPLFPTLSTVTRFGYLGVNLFFMISGFVILWSASNKKPFDFVTARIARLYPTFWASCLVTLSVVLLFGGAGIPIVDLAKNLTMVAGFLDAPYIDDVYWTLQVELKFYVLILLLMLAGQIRNIESWLIGWLLLATPLYLGLRVAPLESLTLYPFSAYFIAGAMLFLVRTQGLTTRRALVLTACFLFAMNHAVVQADKYLFLQDRGVGHLSASIVSVCFALLFVIAMGWVQLPRSRIVFYLGALTYPLYLVHNTAGKLLFDEIAASAGKYHALFLTTTAALAMSALLVVVIEQNLRHAFVRLITDGRNAVLRAWQDYKSGWALNWADFQDWLTRFRL